MKELEQIAEALKNLNATELKALEDFAYNLRRNLERKDEARLKNIA